MDHPHIDVLNRPADEFGNDDLVEELWAMKAYEHAEVYFNMLCSVDPKFLKITQYDDIIYSTFRQDFPKFDVKHLNELAMKSDDSKTKWRTFIEKFNKIDDFSYGTLIRVDADSDFNAENSMLVIRLQFWAIEIARNREGYNDRLRKLYKPKPGDISKEVPVETPET